MDTIKVDTEKLLRFATKMVDLKYEFDFMMREIASIEDTLNSVRDVSTHTQREQLNYIEDMGYYISREFNSFAESLYHASKEYVTLEEKLKNSLGAMAIGHMDKIADRAKGGEDIIFPLYVPKEFKDYRNYLISEEEADKYINSSFIGAKSYKKEEIKDLPPMIAYKKDNKLKDKLKDKQSSDLYIYALSKHYPIGLFGEEEKPSGIEFHDEFLESQSYYVYQRVYTTELEVTQAIMLFDGPVGKPLNGKVEVIDSIKGVTNSERKLLSGSEWNDYFKETYGSRKVRWKNKPVSYDRPSHFRKGVRDKVWENAKNANGDVIDPVTEKVMNKSETWDMGHKPGFEFRKHKQSAKERGISRKQFLNEYNKIEHYRPELPSSNRGHQGEDLTDIYFGD
ncbi:HNH/ENDO VII family nuclease [Clostridium sp. SHJSY1]|uniref:HNH/ENDO VII family nuclease n=1 Tax=Clostridium sp. SHJSY1 TaxID=2942483 RepID=UPI00287BB1C3|nr:HNH/ENDO VII family nuclease [Clostridium sp. SHJSY1]